MLPITKTEVTRSLANIAKPDPGNEGHDLENDRLVLSLKAPNRRAGEKTIAGKTWNRPPRSLVGIPKETSFDHDDCPGIAPKTVSGGLYFYV